MFHLRDAAMNRSETNKNCSFQILQNSYARKIRFPMANFLTLLTLYALSEIQKLRKIESSPLSLLRTSVLQDPSGGVGSSNSYKRSTFFGTLDLVTLP